MAAANPTMTVPTDSTPYTEEKVYWPLNPSNTSDVIYNGEMMGMEISTGYANHFDDTAPMIFLGTKEGILHRLQSDTPASDFKELIRKPRYFEMNLQTGSASIPASIGAGAYAYNSGLVQIGNSGLSYGNLAGMIVDIGRSASTGPAYGGGILALTGATSVVIAPPEWGALIGLIVVGVGGTPATSGTGGVGEGLVVNGGVGGSATTGTGGAGSDITITTGAGGATSAGTGNGGRGGNLKLNAAAGGTSTGGSAGAAGEVIVQSTTAPPSAGAAGAALYLSSTAAFGLYFGSGIPTVTAAQGSVYMNTQGSTTATRLYVMGSAAWIAVTTAT